MTSERVPAPSTAPTDVPAILRLLTADPGRPRLTWYGDDGERVELSGAVLENWVNKTTNLLVEELDAGPGTRVGLELPAHWRTVLWALAAWRAGATVVLPGPDGHAPGDLDVLVTSRPQPPVAAGRGPALVVVTLAALARRAVDRVPAGAIDAAAAVMTYGDRLGWVPPADPTADALERADAAAVTHAGLATWWTAGEPRERVLLAASSDVGAWLAQVVGSLAADGSLVLLSPARTAPPADTPTAADDQREDAQGRARAWLARLAADERVTRELVGT
ncbi:TIGR03089 family protein [Cellulomonas persica]|uniref:Acyl-CoA synthetase n=1 Tax=Cellulomonas persica TaxID=76861 RepID=A0A510UVN0_9CELL|nr:TIGR03089 family protein [Cellulomonas persica]GEK17170.1 acyl-CoA synthetase [Cellulomonas persica]